MRRRTLVTAALGLLLLTGGERMFWAQRPAELLRLREELGLTPEQITRIQEAVKAHRNAAFPLQQELRAKTHELRNALEAPQPNATMIGQLMLEQRELRKRLRELNQKLRADLEAVLTPEQKQKWQQWRQTQAPQRMRRLGLLGTLPGRPGPLVRPR